MENIYLILFIIGLAYAVLTVFVGDIFNIHFDLSGGHLPFISPTTIGSFITVFGGSGYFLSEKTGLSGALVGAISIVIAILVSALMLFFIVVHLLNAEKTAAYSAHEMIGRTAEVITVIMDDSKGEIIYEQGGSRLSAPAKTANGMSIKQGEVVTIVDVISGTFIVQKL
jgi:membrane-bound ClpP family serine protease